VVRPDGHFVDASGTRLQAPLFLPRYLDPAGGIWSTTRDQLRYAAFHLGDGRHDGQRLLQPATLEAMQTAQLPVPGLDLAIGLDWFVQDLGGVRLFLHNGDTGGQHAVVLGVPERQFALALLSNAQPTASALELAVLSEALDRYLGLGGLARHAGVAGAFVADPDAPTLPVPPQTLAAYAGRYQDPETIWDVRLQGDHLVVSQTPTPPPDAYTLRYEFPNPEDVPLTFTEPDVALLGRARLPFVRRPDGSLGWLASSLRLTPRQAGPVPSAAPAQLP
jgi:CubicO group peptidase (beta-lactamase class C family)